MSKTLSPKSQEQNFKKRGNYSCIVRSLNLSRASRYLHQAIIRTIAGCYFVIPHHRETVHSITPIFISYEYNLAWAWSDSNLHHLPGFKDWAFEHVHNYMSLETQRWRSIPLLPSHPTCFGKIVVYILSTLFNLKHYTKHHFWYLIYY